MSREIIDESDVYVDVHKAIRRSHPAPKARVQRKDVMVKDAAVKDGKLIDLGEDNDEDQPLQKSRTASISGRNPDSTPILSSSPRTTLLMRRSSTGQDGKLVRTTVPVKANYEQMKGHLKHLGPSNPASNPKSTKYSNVKIKPGGGNQIRQGSVATESQEPQSDINGVNERTSLLGPSSNGHGSSQAPKSYAAAAQTPAPTNTQTPTLVVTPSAEAADNDTSVKLKAVDSNTSLAGSSKSIVPSLDGNVISAAERQRVKRGNVRSGSITEFEVNSGGVRKFVLEATSSGEEEGSESNKTSPTSSSQKLEDVNEDDKSADDVSSPTETDPTTGGSSQGQSKKKNRKKKRKGGK